MVLLGVVFCLSYSWDDIQADKNWGGTSLLIIVSVCFWLLPLPNIFGLHNLQRLFVFYVAGFIIKYKNYKTNAVLNMAAAALWAISVYIVVRYGHQYIIGREMVNARYGYMLLNRLIIAIIAGAWIYVLFVVSKEIKQSDRIEMLGSYSLDLYALQGFPTVAVRYMQHLLSRSMVFDVIFTIVYTVLLTFGLFLFSRNVIRKNKWLSLMLIGKKNNN